MLRFIFPGIMLLISAYTDIKERVIYSEVVVVFLAGALVLGALPGAEGLPSLLMGAGLGLLMAVASVLSRGKLGMGDSLLFIVLGLYLGFEINLTLLMFSLLLSSFYSMGLMVLKRAPGGLKFEYPFSPFIFAAYLIMICFGVR